jgi:hypothetical protein
MSGCSRRVRKASANTKSSQAPIANFLSIHLFGPLLGQDKAVDNWSARFRRVVSEMTGADGIWDSADTPFHG